MYDGPLGQLGTWGFRCVGEVMWRKRKMGRGRFWRNMHEVCYLGVRGKTPAFAESLPSVLDAPCGKFGTKPEAIYSMIEKLAPGPLLELFGTQVHPWLDGGGDHLVWVCGACSRSRLT